MIHHGFKGIMLGLCLGVAWAATGTAVQAQESQDDVTVKTYRQAVAVDPTDVIAHFNLGLALYKLERYDQAKQVLVKCLALNRADTRAHNQVDGPTNQILGIIYYNYSREDRKAIEAFQRSLKSLPKDSDTHYALGLAFLRQQNSSEALKAFDQAVQCGKTQDADLYYQRGLVLAEMGREEEAAASYAAALKIKPDFTQALENLALLYYRQEKDAETLDALQRLIQIDPMNFNANYLLGLHYYRKKMYSEMVAAYTRAVAVKPDLADVHYNLGMACYFQNRYEQAVEALKKAVALNPKDADAYNLLGQAQTAAVENYLHAGSTFLAQEKYAAAAVELQKVFAIDANNAKAKILLEDARRMMRESFASHMRLADRFLRENKLEDAYNEYDQAAAINPESVEALEGRRKTGAQLGKLLAQRIQKAKAAEQSKDYADAAAQYQSALALKPDYGPAKTALTALRTQLGQEVKKMLAQAGQDEEKDRVLAASANYRKALRLLDVVKDEKTQEKALSGLTRVNARRVELIRQHLAQGKKDMSGGMEAKAKESFNAVLKLDPQNKAANEHILKLTGAQSQAKVTDEEIKTTYYRGVDFYVNGKIEEAIQEWEKVIQLDPENQDARINIARAQQKLAAIRRLTEGY